MPGNKFFTTVELASKPSSESILNEINKISGILNNAERNANWYLLKSDRKTIMNHIKFLQKHGNSEQILSLYDHIKKGFDNTQNGEKPHGVFVGLINECTSMPRFLQYRTERRVARELQAENSTESSRLVAG